MRVNKLRITRKGDNGRRERNVAFLHRGLEFLNSKGAVKGDDSQSESTAMFLCNGFEGLDFMSITWSKTAFERFVTNDRTVNVKKLRDTNTSTKRKTHPGLHHNETEIKSHPWQKSIYIKKIMTLIYKHKATHEPEKFWRLCLLPLFGVTFGLYIIPQPL